VVLWKFKVAPIGSCVRTGRQQRHAAHALISPSSRFDVIASIHLLVRLERKHWATAGSRGPAYGGQAGTATKLPNAKITKIFILSDVSAILLLI
jgi:hypothetical protein